MPKPKGQTLEATTATTARVPRQRQASTASAIPACPAWCVNKHDQERWEDAGFLYHESRLINVPGLGEFGLNSTTNALNGSPDEPPAVFRAGDGGELDWSVEDAKRVAAQFIVAIIDLSEMVSRDVADYSVVEQARAASAASKRGGHPAWCKETHPRAAEHAASIATLTNPPELGKATLEISLAQEPGREPVFYFEASEGDGVPIGVDVPISDMRDLTAKLLDWTRTASETALEVHKATRKE